VTMTNLLDARFLDKMNDSHCELRFFARSPFRYVAAP